MHTYILIMVLASNLGYGHIHSVEMSSKATCGVAANKFNGSNSTAFCVEK